VQPPGNQAIVTPGVQVGQQHGECLPDDPSAVHGETESAQAKPGPFQVQQFTAGQVDRDLLGVPLPPAGQALGFGGRFPPGRAEEFGDSWKGYPP
jgi:hypothetical protein